MMLLLLYLWYWYYLRYLLQLPASPASRVHFDHQTVESNDPVRAAFVGVAVVVHHTKSRADRKILRAIVRLPPRWRARWIKTQCAWRWLQIWQQIQILTTAALVPHRPQNGNHVHT
jgi:hypothetical protein